MSEMVERLAESLSQVTYLGNEAVPWAERPEKTKDWCRRMARTAITDMREPTPYMESAARNADPAVINDEYADCLTHWRAMIDAALLDPPAESETAEPAAETATDDH